MTSSEKPLKVPKKARKRVPCHKVGRPRIYTQLLLEKLAVSLEEWVEANRKAKDKLFLLGDWCFEVGFDMRYFKRYADENVNFKRAYFWAKQWQEHQVAKGALNNDLNPRFSQFFLGCNHKWSTIEESGLKEEKEKSRLQHVSEVLHSLQKKIEKEEQDEDE